MSTVAPYSSGIRGESSTQHLASMAAEYCHLIDGFDGFGQNDQDWLMKMRRLLSRLHVAVLRLNPAQAQSRHYCFPDDDKRCELYMHLHGVMDPTEIPSDSAVSVCAENIDYELCDTLADDFTDMYFDLKDGLDLFERDPQQAMHTWLASFYRHWGVHLLDAENWLLEMEAR